LAAETTDLCRKHGINEQTYNWKAKWRESSVEEALIEMYLAGVSVRRVEDIMEALWGTRVSPSTVSNLLLKEERDAAA
jgi:hypothetical protein